MSKDAPFNGPYDPDRYMFKRTNVTLDSKVLIMWRKLAESGKLGRKPEGPPAGEIAMAIVLQTGLPVEKIMDRAISDHIAKTGDY